MRAWPLAALLAPAFVACGLDRAGTHDDAALDATSSGDTTTGGGTSAMGSGTSSGPPAGGAGGAGGRDPSSGGAGGAGGAPLECWGPDTICCANAIPCPTATMECCLTDQYSGEFGTCVDRGTCPTLTINCDDSEDCPGSICCITWNGYNYQSVKCEDACDPPYFPGDPGKYPMCNLAGGTCPGDLDCHVDAYVGEVGWGYCF